MRQRLQSEMTAEVVESVMSGNGTALPTFAESAKLHRKLIGALLGHMTEIGEFHRRRLPDHLNATA